MHSSKSRCRCGPRGLSPGCTAGISAIRKLMREPISPDTGSSAVRPGRPRRFACACLSSVAITSPDHFTLSLHLPQALDLGGAALHGVELGKNLRRLARDGVGDVLEHA